MRSRVEKHENTQKEMCLLFSLFIFFPFFFWENEQENKMDKNLERK